MPLSFTDVGRLIEKTNAEFRFAGDLKNAITRSAACLEEHDSVFMDEAWVEHVARCELGDPVLKSMLATVQFWSFMINAVQNKNLGDQEKLLAGMKENIEIVMREYQQFAEKAGLANWDRFTEPMVQRLQLLVYGEPGCSYKENDAAYKAKLMEMQLAIKAVQNWKFDG
jgi:hypothetical protein